MNGNDEELALADLEDDQIHLLGDIIRLAATYRIESCTKALTTAYNTVLAERGIDSNHDKIFYNWVTAISARCAKVKLEEGQVVFWNELKNVCQSKDITLVEPEDDEDPGSSLRKNSDYLDGEIRKPKPDRRRVSFDEARYEETQLSEHSDLVEQTPDGKAILGRRPPTPGRPYYSQRARSADTDERHWSTTKVINHASPTSLYASEPDGPADSSMLLRSTVGDDERDGQLQDILDAFHAMSDVRLIRRSLHLWHDAFISHSSRRTVHDARAVAYDRRLMLSQVMEILLTATRTKIQIRQHEEEYEHKERKAAFLRDLMLKHKVFEHWRNCHLILKKGTADAGKLLLALRYFRRWREITAENNSKSRLILSRKCLGRWRDRTVRRQLVYEQAMARYEESVQKRLFKEWLRQLCSRKAEQLHQERTTRQALRQWAARSHRLQDMSREADLQRSRRPLGAVARMLHSRLQERQQAATAAQAHYERKTRSNCMHTLVIQGRLSPLEKIMSLRVTLTLQRKAFSVWHLHVSLTRQATEVDRKRVLQNAWTSWNDKLRTRALAQRMDERLLVDHLYKWVLQERLSLFRRTSDARLARHGLLLLHSAVDEYRSTLEGRVAIFAENQRRRTLATSMVHLNVALRQHEDAERKAVEFVNGRALPDVLGEWKAKSQHARKLAKMAADARWYCLASSTLKTWRSRTTEHQHQRRRDAYVHIRAQVKYKLASKCFMTWRTKSMEIRSMNDESQRRAQARVFAIGTHAFDQWRDATRSQTEHEAQAVRIDDQRLLVSAFAAMLTRHSDEVALEQRATAFRLDSNLALQASALKSIQWATFKASQQIKTADALLVRNSEKHVKDMLRHWFIKASSTRAARLDQPTEPESPSIRPASRAAARSASKERFAPSHSMSYTPGTPGYMRTPSRSKRAGRFKPIPTPAAVTPFALEPGYLATTPAPFATAENNDSPSLPAGLTPQVTPFARKLRAGGFAEMPPSALKTSVLGRSTIGTGKSVRFASAGRFARSTAGRIEVRREIEEEDEGDGEGGRHFKSG